MKRSLEGIWRYFGTVFGVCWRCFGFFKIHPIQLGFETESSIKTSELWYFYSNLCAQRLDLREIVISGDFFQDFEKNGKGFRKLRLMIALGLRWIIFRCLTSMRYFVFRIASRSTKVVNWFPTHIVAHYRLLLSFSFRLAPYHSLPHPSLTLPCLSVASGLSIHARCRWFGFGTLHFFRNSSGCRFSFARVKLMKKSFTCTKGPT